MPRAPIHAAPGGACRQRHCRCGSAGNRANSRGTWRASRGRRADSAARQADRPGRMQNTADRTQETAAPAVDYAWACLCPTRHAQFECHDRNRIPPLSKCPVPRTAGNPFARRPLVRANEQAPQVRRQGRVNSSRLPWRNAATIRNRPTRPRRWRSMKVPDSMCEAPEEQAIHQHRLRFAAAGCCGCRRTRLPG